MFRTLDINGAEKVTPAPSVFTLTTTGNIDDLDFANADLIRFNNASLATLRGLKAGSDGQKVTIVSIGAGEVDLAHQNTNSAAANRAINFVTSGITPLAPGVGAATYQYDVTTARWRLTSHDQGAYLTPAYASGNFTGSGTLVWTVDSGDVGTLAYRVIGRSLYIAYDIQTSTVSGSGSGLHIALPNGYTAAKFMLFVNAYVLDNSSTPQAGYTSVGAAGSFVSITKLTETNYAASTNNTRVIGALEMELT